MRGQTSVGARLNLPRDLQVAYALGRMGAATTRDLWPLFWGSPHTARTGLRRLVRLGLVRTFPREDPSRPHWFSLAAPGVGWVAEQAGCEETELRRFTGLGRVNLAALSMRNRFWVSLILACRREAGVKLQLFRPEWELRPAKRSDVAVVPDAVIVLGAEPEAPGSSCTWMVELDGGSERRAIWEHKARVYRGLRTHGALYGAATWRVLALVPSLRRAQSIASAIVNGGAGAFTFLGIAESLEIGHALEKVLWRADELCTQPSCSPSRTLYDGVPEEER